MCCSDRVQVDKVGQDRASHTTTEQGIGMVCQNLPREQDSAAAVLVTSRTAFSSETLRQTIRQTPKIQQMYPMQACLAFSNQKCCALLSAMTLQVMGFAFIHNLHVTFASCLLQQDYMMACV
jgi:hypothetical protein